MMSYNEFLKIVDPLLAKFQIRKNMAESLQIDYESLRYQDPEVLREAVNYVLENHWGQDYPTLAELLEAAEKIRERKAKTEDVGKEGDYICGACCDEGIVFWPDTEKASFCSCEKGMRKRAAFEEYRRTGDERGATRAFEEADISGAKLGPRIYRKHGPYRELTEKWDERLKKRLEWKKINIGKKEGGKK